MSTFVYGFSFLCIIVRYGPEFFTRNEIRSNISSADGVPTCFVFKGLSGYSSSFLLRTEFSEGARGEGLGRECSSRESNIGGGVFFRNGNKKIVVDLHGGAAAAVEIWPNIEVGRLLSCYAIPGCRCRRFERQK